MNWIKAHKVSSAIIAVVILIIIVGAAGGDNKKQKDNSSMPSVATNSPTQTQVKQNPKSQVPAYKLVGTSGAVRVYLIDPADDTEPKITLLGKDIFKKFESENIVRISIFTDRNQAKIMADNPLAPADLEGSAAAAYDKAYVAQLNTNRNTGLKDFRIFAEGLDGPSKTVSF